MKSPKIVIGLGRRASFPASSYYVPRLASASTKKGRKAHGVCLQGVSDEEGQTAARPFNGRHGTSRGARAYPTIRRTGSRSVSTSRSVAT